MKLLDTSVLIHLQREWTRDEDGPVHAYLRDHGSEEFSISVITSLEFLEGYAQVAEGERFLEPFPQIEVTRGVARSASRIRRSLRQRGEMIGDFDILIAATALVAGVPLVTDNTQHFERVEGLVMERYR
ncbi:MAG: type II toxin-antitoxin system VapC family toxin [Akkermansiaceae bacterium]|nr:type II toxin-antitoxin system VapC family toxin [Akkermansiaceae bacterium]